ncbi:tRNA wybutosine-synthesizing protein 2 [Picrophilus oshimae DSM 9789]|uniref:tRNA wybutosine-synthesizing protein 2 n=2 Tax=Picrophilus oshimae TaxID=46632 RepID=A0A8G2FVU9_PICTO|nr:tRNA wybutosine-synthesizing protein 2 [Picrophilus oshimae DSM 9789]
MPMLAHAIKVEKHDIKTLKRIERSGIVNRDLVYDHDEDYIYVPVIKNIDGSISHDFKEKNSIKTMLKNEMERNGIKNYPEKWVRIGSSIIIKNTRHEKIIGSILAEILNVSSVYMETGRIHGDLRKPSLKLIYGSGGETLHLENGVKYLLDPEKVMFSPGNINERSNIYEDLNGKVFMDMFAGIGYFSIPALKYKRPSGAILCDINPEAIKFLKRNIEINNIKTRVEIFNCDSRLISSKIKADYIMMGNFKSIEFLPHALSHIKNNGKISMHYLTDKNYIKNSYEPIIKKARSYGYNLTLYDYHRVKSVSPFFYHVNARFNISKI